MHQPPLILTASLDEPSFQYFNTLRQQHFPPKLNYLNAHFTLFHALPNEAIVIDKVKSVAQSHAPIQLSVTAPVSIGRGVAFKIESTALMQMHTAFQNEWQLFLTPQDKQKRWPHITIQNKVTPQEARTLLAEVKADFTPFTITATGLQLWEYLNGPWKLLQAFLFA